MYTTALVLTQNNTKVENIMYLLSVTNPIFDKVESSPSETLVAWTDPAFPAFVEVSLSSQSHISKSDFNDSSKLGLQDSEIT